MAAKNIRLDLLASLTQDEHPTQTLMQNPLDPRLFIGPAADAYEYMMAYLMKTGELPPPSIIEHETGVTLPEAVEGNYLYHLDKVTDHYVHNHLVDALVDLEDVVNNGDSDTALSSMNKVVMDLKMFQNRNEIFNFTEQGSDMLVQDITAKIKAGDQGIGISTGWEYLDKMIGGLIGGDFMGIVGRPAAGKTYLALYIANHVWATQNKVPLVVSMEMSPIAIMQRISAMHFKKSITQVKQASLSSGALHDLMVGLKAMDGSMPDYWILDGNLTAKVDDLIVAVQQIKPDVVIVDGAYLLGTSDPRSPKWQQIGDNAEAMKKHIAGALGIPVVASYQLNRGYMKDVKLGNAPGVEHIAGADAIGQIASVVIGLMQEEGIETMVHRTVQVLKGRSGESGQWDINWIFDKYPFMDFSEMKKSTDGAESQEEANNWNTGELQFL